MTSPQTHPQQQQQTHEQPTHGYSQPMQGQPPNPSYPQQDDRVHQQQPIGQEPNKEESKEPKEQKEDYVDKGSSGSRVLDYLYQSHIPPSALTYETLIPPGLAMAQKKYGKGGKVDKEQNKKITDTIRKLIKKITGVCGKTPRDFLVDHRRR